MARRNTGPPGGPGRQAGVPGTRGRGCEGSTALARGAATLVAHGGEGPTVGRRIGRLMIPLHKASRLNGGYVECSPRRGSPRSGLEDYRGEVDVLPEPNVERCARCEQEMASKGEGRTRGAALSPWRHESKRERQSAPYGWS